MFKNQSKHKFIVIEGIDGSGKTTIATELSKRLSCHIYKPPPKNISLSQTPLSMTLREYVDQKAFDAPQIRFLFYLFGLAQASTEICSLLQTNHVVCDRYIASTLVYHQVLDPNLQTVNFDWLNIVEPDFQFLLTLTNYASISKRIHEKDISNSDNRLENNILFLLNVQSQFRKLGLPEISTDANTVNETLAEILRSLEVYG